MTLNVDTIQKPDGSPVDLTGQQTVKAYAHCVVSGGNWASAESLNISSITDLTTGQYGQNFTNAFASDNYAMAGMNNGSVIVGFNTDFTASYHGIYLVNTAGTPDDWDPSATMYVGDLA